ncbi:MAG: hypothetical protein GEV04_22160 [Actinophytocola sp.]|nr:hypothetical protein [Actinophytocola sp.]
MDRTDIAFVITGVVIVLIVGQLLSFVGKRYVAGAGGAGSNVGTVATLLSMVFYLVTLGLTALISVLPVGTGASSFMLRLGVLLLVLGAAFGVFVGALARRREVAITEAAVTDSHEHDPDANPSVPSHSPSYLPPSGLPGTGDGT